MSDLFASQNFDTPFFPKQAIPEIKKTKSWYMENIDVGVSLSEYDTNNGIRANREEKISNVNLYNDIVDRKEVEGVINPYNLSGKFPDTYRNYSITNSRLSLLFGEERKRLFNPISYVINSDAVSNKNNIIDEKFRSIIENQVTGGAFSKDDFERKMAEFEKWRKYTFQDVYERMSNQVIQYVLNSTNIKSEWSRNFEDLLIQAEEIMSIDIVGDNFVFERLDPTDVYTFRSCKDSYMIEDSDIIVISKFVPIGTVIDNFHDYLSKKDKDWLENVHTTRTPGSSLFPDGQIKNRTYNIDEEIDQIGIDKAIYNVSKGARTKHRDYDDQGNVRVTRTLWKGQRKIGIVEYMDKEGKTQKKQVPEQYEAKKDLGETVEWIYISEWYEGTRIGGNIYVKYGPRPIQFRDPDNPSLCHPGIVGNILNTNSFKAKSLMSYMKPYQLLYNFFMFRLQQDFIKYQGHIAKMNLAMKPDNWSMDKVMFYMQQFGIMVEDPFNEGLEGAATGKLAGTHAQGSGGSMQIGDANIIQMNMMMLDFLEQRIADISGVSPQRMGAVQNRETKGGVERSVMQSSNNTEKYYSIHDDFRLRCLKVIIGTISVAWRNKNEKKAFVLDDGTMSILNFEGSKFSQGSYGIATTMSSDTANMMNDLKALGQAFMQNDGSLSALMDVYMTKSPASLKNKLEQYEAEVRRRQDESEKRQMEMQQQQIQSAEKMRAEEMLHEKELKQMEIDGKIELELIKNNITDNNIDIEKINSDKSKLEKDYKIKEAQLREIKRHNLATESISRRKMTNK